MCLLIALSHFILCTCTNHVSFAMLYLYRNSNNNLPITALSETVCFLLLLLFSHTCHTCQKADCPFCWACLVECCVLYCLSHLVASPSCSLCDYCLDPDDSGIQAAWETSWVWLWKKRKCILHTTKTYGTLKSDFSIGIGIYPCNTNAHRKLWFCSCKLLAFI